MTWKQNNSASNRSSEETPDEKDIGNSNSASDYIRDNYEPEDRLAAVLINKRTGSTIQRIASAESLAEDDSQQWLRYMNDKGYEVYLSANALKEAAKSRTKEDVGIIRHIYLDIDKDGDNALKRLSSRSDLPKPNYLFLTSPGKYQVLWKVNGFTKEQAEEFERRLVRDTGADVAVTDSARVLRLPGFYNHKYNPPHLIEAREISRQTYTPKDFPDLQDLERQSGEAPDKSPTASAPKQKPAGRITQSERDWAYARRAISRGDDRESIITAIESYRRFDKHNSRKYAERTVNMAIKSLKINSQEQTHIFERSR